VEQYQSVSWVATQLGCRPRDISDLLYTRILDVSRCVVIAGRRLIPEGYLPEIRRILAERGRLPVAAGGAR
jgi:hypothetical protein